MEPFAQRINPAKKYVVSSTLGQADWNAELVRGDLGKAVQQLKREPGKGLLRGRRAAPAGLTELGLIDEYEFVVQPRLAGHGPTLFAGLSKHVDLKLVEPAGVRLGGGGDAVRAEKVAVGGTFPGGSCRFVRLCHSMTATAAAPARSEPGHHPRWTWRRGQGSLTRASPGMRRYFPGGARGAAPEGHAVTRDHARKKAIRARMAASGEPYSAAARKLDAAGADDPPPPTRSSPTRSSPAPALRLRRRARGSRPGWTGTSPGICHDQNRGSRVPSPGWPGSPPRPPGSASHPRWTSRARASCSSRASGTWLARVSSSRPLTGTRLISAGTPRCTSTASITAARQGDRCGPTTTRSPRTTRCPSHWNSCGSCAT